MQVIKRGKQILCVTFTDYDVKTVREMKKAGLKITQCDVKNNQPTTGKK